MDGGFGCNRWFVYITTLLLRDASWILILHCGPPAPPQRHLLLVLLEPYCIFKIDKMFFSFFCRVPARSRPILNVRGTRMVNVRAVTRRGTRGLRAPCRTCPHSSRGDRVYSARSKTAKHYTYLSSSETGNNTSINLLL